MGRSSPDPERRDDTSLRRAHRGLIRLPPTSLADENQRRTRPTKAVEPKATRAGSQEQQARGRKPGTESKRAKAGTEERTAGHSERGAKRERPLERAGRRPPGLPLPAMSLCRTPPQLDPDLSPPGAPQRGVTPPGRRHLQGVNAQGAAGRSGGWRRMPPEARFAVQSSCLSV